MTTTAVEREAAVSIFGPEVLSANPSRIQDLRTPGPQGQSNPTVALYAGRAEPKLDGEFCQDIEMLEQEGDRASEPASSQRGACRAAPSPDPSPDHGPCKSVPAKDSTGGVDNSGTH